MILRYIILLRRLAGKNFGKLADSRTGVQSRLRTFVVNRKRRNFRSGCATFARHEDPFQLD